jgi:hypothetical protein
MLPNTFTELPKTVRMRVTPTLTLFVRTLTTPVEDAFIASWYAYDDSTSKRYENDSPGWSRFDLKMPVSETISWAVVSLFVHVTVSPGRMVTCSGERPVAVIETVLETVRSPEAAEATHANASTAMSGRNIRFM